MTPIYYPCSTQGGDRTSSASSRYGGETFSVVGNSLVYCTLTDCSREVAWAFLKANTGWELNYEIWVNKIGR